jgi:DHA1 family bicyclomycin/chloramphenicol resistance-like MFS transporter
VFTLFSRKPPTIPLLTVLISGSAIAYNLYLPSIPDISRVFAVDTFTVHVTLIVFLVAYAVAQFFYGGVADRFGRRPVLLWALAIYIVASLACAWSSSIAELLAARVFQGVGAAGPIVLVRAMVRDLYDRKRSARALAVISTVMVFAPATAPAIGGWLQTDYGWQASFYALAGFGTALFAWCCVRMAETHISASGDLIGNLRAMATGYRLLAGERAYVAYCLNIGFISGGIFAWLAETPVVLISSYGLAPDEYGLLLLTATVGAFLGYANAIWMTARLGVNRMIVLGTFTLFAGACVYLALPLAGVFTAWAAVTPIVLYSFGLAIAFPSVMAAAVSVRPDYAGTAAAMNGLVQYGTAAAATLVVGLLPYDTHLPLAWVVFVMASGAAIASVVGWRSRPAE